MAAGGGFLVPIECVGGRLMVGFIARVMAVTLVHLLNLLFMCKNKLLGCGWLQRLNELCALPLYARSFLMSPRIAMSGFIPGARWHGINCTQCDECWFNCVVDQG